MTKLYKSWKRWLVVLLMTSFFDLSYGQIGVSGTVKDVEGGKGLPGVNVTVKGTKTGTITDINGYYKINVPDEKSVLVFSMIGYGAEEITINSQTTINVSMEMDIRHLEEIVVIGYGGQKKREVTGAVGSIKSDQILKTSSSDVLRSMQGQIAGVNIQASSGAPGAISNIQIRGVGSFSRDGGALSPLYVVDGIPYNGNPNITPEEIASIEVLKDGASAAIYGTRASNGVILITTKTGKAGTMRVNFSSYYGIQNITSGTPLMNTREALYASEIAEQARGTGRHSSILQFNPDALYHDSDFVGDVTNDNASLQNYNLTLSGGKEDVTYSIISNYYAQDGVLINSSFDKISTRVNGTIKKGRFDAFASIGISRTTKEVEPWALFQNAIEQKPWLQPVKPGESDVIIPGQNPDRLGGFAQTLEQSNDESDNSINVALNLKYEIINGLKYQVRAGGNIWNHFTKRFSPQYIVRDENGAISRLGTQDAAELTQKSQFSQKWTLENLLTYDKSIGEHSFSLLAGYTREQTDWRISEFKKTNFLSNDTQVFDAGSELATGTGRDEAGALTGLLGRLQYNFREKYIFSASIRRDGSSNFGSSNRYKTFPGVSIGWNITEENFMKGSDALSFIHNMKFRASYALVGNQSIRRYAYAAVIDPNIDYPFNGEGNETLFLGAAQRGFANPLVQWESNISRNIGMDITMFQGKFDLIVDVYRNSKKDMLLPLELPPSTGTWVPRDWEGRYKTVITNVGDMVNEGIEVTATYRKVESNGLSWNITSTFTKNVNEVVDLANLGALSLGGGAPIISRPNIENTTFLTEGFPVPGFFLIPTEGIIKSEEELEVYKSALIGSTAKVGDLKYTDTNGDSLLTDHDRVYQGSGAPEFEMGLAFNGTFKNFDLSLQLYYAHGGKVYNGSKAFAYGFGRHKDLYYQWSPQNPDSDIPSSRPEAEHLNSRTWSDYFLEDATYLRIKNISLGYSLPKAVLDKLSWDRFRLYLSAQNLFTFTDYEGYDPEVGGDGLFLRGVDRGSYPVARRFLAGVQIDF